MMKEKRIAQLEICMNELKAVSVLYKQASPAWILIQATWCHLKSIHHLEAETKFDSKTLGAKDEEA